MDLRDIKLSSLIINPSNDRHGDLSREQDAMLWLLEHKADHIKHLAGDIVNQGQIYEPPLVVPQGDKYLVYDGNRRVCCLKMLDSPAFAATLTPNTTTATGRPTPIAGVSVVWPVALHPDDSVSIKRL